MNKEVQENRGAIARPVTISKEALQTSIDNPKAAWRIIGQVPVELLLEDYTTNVPPKPTGAVRFVCISDTHDQQLRSPSLIADLPDGDVLIHAGDFTQTGKPKEIAAFCEFISKQPHRHKLFIAGNHELTLDPTSYEHLYYRFGHRQRMDVEAIRIIQETLDENPNITYLCNSSVDVEGVTVYGSPYQPEFGGWAFNLRRGEESRECWKKIPINAQVVITHGPPLGYGDLCFRGQRAGCADLLDEIQSRVRPEFHVFGHIHEDYGITTDGTTKFVNASTCDLFYNPTHHPIVFDVFPANK